MYKYRIEKLKFREGLELNPSQLVVFVGPNNSGKSRALKDILQLATTQNRETKILENIDFSMPDSYEVLSESYKINTVKENGQIFIRALNSSLEKPYNLNVGNETWYQSVGSWLKPGNYNEGSKNNFSHYFGTLLVTLLTTEDRLKLIKESVSSHGPNNIDNILQAFYHEGIEIENNLRNFLKSAFHLDIRLDYSALQRLCFRIGKELEDIPGDPRQSRELFEKFEKMDDQGDGIKSFVSTYLSIILGNKPVLLLDEPEAFLHPPQALRIGELIAEKANDGRQIFVATHSSDLLRGILSKRQDITLVRFYREEKGSYNLLDSDKIRTISNDPLLSSSRVLEGIFYKGVVIVEADSDATFYQRIARQVKSFDDIHYVNAHNKQTVSKVAAPYKELGVKFCVIVDFDVMREKDEFESLINRLSFGPEEVKNLVSLRGQIVAEIESVSPEQLLGAMQQSIRALLDNISNDPADSSTRLLKARRELKKIREEHSSWFKYKQEGYLALTPEKREVFHQLYTICVSKGLFIVPFGELESWLAGHGVERTSNKSRWIVSALEKLPQLQMDEKQEPWKFIKQVHEYLYA
jgi:predicted ATPase